MSRDDLFNEIICQECGHVAKAHGLAQCYGDDGKCKCSNKLGILIAALEEDANWSGCELEDTQKEHDMLAKKLEMAIMTLRSMSNQATCQVYIREKLVEIERIGKEAQNVEPQDY